MPIIFVIPSTRTFGDARNLTNHLKMAPTAIYDTIIGKPGPANDLPPPKLYPVKEVKFEKPVPVHTDGREKALQHTDGSAAIVIDNGELASHSHLAPSQCCCAI